MKALALDTTTRAGSVAIVDDDRVIGERMGDAARTHAERLPRELVALLDAHGVALADVDLFAVAAGPGSFTGLRIGIATMQGLAFVHRRRIVGVPALEALAHLGSRGVEPGGFVAALMDAHRRDVFAALYEVAPAPLFDPARLAVVEDAMVGDPASTLARWAGDQSRTPRVFIGDGAMMCADLIAARVPSARVVEAPPLAGAIGRIAIARARRDESVAPARIQPLYVRRADAEIAKETALTRNTLSNREGTDGLVQGKP